MKLIEAIEQTKLNLLDTYKDVKYKETEKVKISRNSITSNYLSETIDIESIEVELIEDRQAIEGEINALKVTFEVKYPRKRKYRIYDVYYIEV